MNRKQFLILMIALVVLGGIGLVMFRQDIAAFRSSEAEIGQYLVPGLKVGDVAQVVLRDAQHETTLVRKTHGWVVRQRNDYPANFQDVSDLLIKLLNLKVIQNETVATDLLPRLDLATPLKTAEPAVGKATAAKGTGTLLELKSAKGKTLATLTLGKVVLRQDPTNPLPSAQNGVPAGRFILAAGSHEVVVVADPLSKVVAEPTRWLDPAFVTVNHIQALAVSGRDGMNWKITRDQEYSDWKFAEGPGKLNASAAVSAVNALGDMTFKDVDVAPQAGKPQQPIMVTADTFNKLVYTIKLVPSEGGDYLLTFNIAGTPPQHRVPGKNETPKEKMERDKEFEQSLKKLEARIARERALEKWTYVVAAKTVAPLLKDRAEMVEAKK